MVMDEYLANASVPTPQTQKVVCSLAYELGFHMALTNFHLDDLSKLSHMALTVLVYHYYF